MAADRISPSRLHREEGSKGRGCGTGRRWSIHVDGAALLADWTQWWAASLWQFREEKTGTESTTLEPKSLAPGDVTLHSATMEWRQDIVRLVYFADIYYRSTMFICTLIIKPDHIPLPEWIVNCVCIIMNRKIIYPFYRGTGFTTWIWLYDWKFLS